MTGRRLLVLLMLLWPGVLLAEQTAQMSAAYQPDTGRKDIDAGLVDINYYVERHPDAFVDALHHQSGVARPQLQQWLQQPGRQAADLYLACQLAVIVEQPCQQLLQARDAAGDEGWQAALQAQQIRLDSRQWRALRQAIVRSYQVWARPLPQRLRGG